MDARDIFIDTQLESVSQEVTECERLKTRLAAAQKKLAELDRVRTAELAGLESHAAAELQKECERIQAEADSDLATLRADCQMRRQSLQQNHQRRIQSLHSDLESEKSKCEERRRSELWMLQSVMDEEVDNTPVTEFEREAETFNTQKTFLNDRFTLLQEHAAQARDHLAHCHAAADDTLPPSTVKVRKRLELRDAAVSSGDALLAEAEQLHSLHLPHWVKGMRIWGFGLLSFVVLWIAVAAIKADLRQFINADIGNPDWEWAGVAALIALSVVILFGFILLYRIQNGLRTRFESMLQHMSNAQAARNAWERKTEKYIDHLEENAETWRKQMEQRRIEQAKKIKTEMDARIAELDDQLTRESSVFATDLEQQLSQLDAQTQEAETQITDRMRVRLEQIRVQSADKLTQARQECEHRYRHVAESTQSESLRTHAAWKDAVARTRAIAQASGSIAAATLRWPRLDAGWKLPDSMPECISVGDILATVPGAPESIADSESTSLCVEMPAVLRFPGDTSILVEHDSSGREVALSFLRTQILKLLSTIPAGRIRLTLIDPVGLGQSFSAMMHLADFDELLIHSRIWTDGSQIRDQLQKVTEHMENIFQTYLRSQFETIEEYNASAGEVAEPYHFVVVAGFPTAFTDEAARHLSSILTSGPRCGVHALVAWNPAVAPPPTFDTDDLVNSCVRFRVENNTIQPHTSFSKALIFEAFPEPAAEEYVRLVREVGEQSKDARRVEVSFTRIAPRDSEIWTHSTADGIDLPIGRAGAARLQFMRLGRGTSQHVLVAGKTGSGKSTLLHILITNLAMHYSPREIQFYLIDFKKGVEFRTYAANKLPHARVVAIESDREFGLSVLERLDEILQERGELFRERGIQDVPAFRAQFSSESMPRLLLLIDEFQEFFVAEDRVSARASLLLDRLVRQGRAFGIHVLLGSQTLGGAYSLARSTMGQIAVRIALQCSESDAHLILSEDNSAARLLSRPGEAIYNDANGLVQGNHQFQIAWLDESRREEAIHAMLANQHAEDASTDTGMVVFEGNVPPTAELCGPMNAELKSSHDVTRRSAEGINIWLGEPVAIAAPTCAELRRASGQNVLIVGQDENQVDSILAHSILSCCCRPLTDGTIVEFIHDGRDVESLARFESLERLLNSRNLSIRSASHCDAIVTQFYQEVLSREENSELANAPEKILVVRNVGQFRSLRKDEDDFGLGGFGEPKELTSSGMFSDILKRGPLVGIHVIVWSDTFSNAVRWLSSSLLREFESRIAFRMNQTDSASLVDSPVAASLGPGRALLYRDQTGTTEKFRPFSWPSADWLAEIVPSPKSAPNEGFDIDSLTIE